MVTQQQMKKNVQQHDIKMIKDAFPESKQPVLPTTGRAQTDKTWF